MSCELPRFSSYSRTLVRWHAVTHLWPTILACPPCLLVPTRTLALVHIVGRSSVSRCVLTFWFLHACSKITVARHPAQHVRAPPTPTASSDRAATQQASSACTARRTVASIPPQPQRAVWIQRGLAPSLVSSHTATLRQPYGAAYALAVRRGACCLVVQPPPLWIELAVFWLSLLRTAQARREPLSDGARPPTLSVPGSWAA